MFFIEGQMDRKELIEKLCAHRYETHPYRSARGHTWEYAGFSLKAAEREAAEDWLGTIEAIGFRIEPAEGKKSD
jgi:hypothetical protein